MADAIKYGEEIIDSLEADAALAEIPAGQNLGVQFAPLAEAEALADADFAAGPNQAFPIIGLCRKLACQQNFDTAVKKSTGRRIAGADSLCADAHAAAIKPCRKDPGIVEDQQVSGSQ